MPLVTKFVQCWYFQGRISRTTCWLVLIQFQLEMQTQQVGQFRGSSLTIWSNLSRVKCLVRKIQFALFWTTMIPVVNPTIDVAKENGISLLTLPPHTSHKLRSLDCNISVHTECMWCGRKVMRLATLCTKHLRCYLPLYMAVTLNPAVGSLKVWTCYSCYAIVENVWSEVVFVRCVSKLVLQNF